MLRPIPSKQLDAMLELRDLRKRYGHCVKMIADLGSLWWLESARGRCVLGPTAQGAMLLPVWPHPDYASAYLRLDPVAAVVWATSEPMEIEVHEFIDEHVPELIKTGYAIAAFPIPPGQACIVSVDDFAANLQFELDQVE
ncbi:MAG: DUF2750 domain-containing protein [Planctomycetes bacterium]|nr:DUF2750 domain-containing protein [Planctomycetota bacterium]